MGTLVVVMAVVAVVAMMLVVVMVTVGFVLVGFTIFFERLVMVDAYDTPVRKGLFYVLIRGGGNKWER
jgi:fatty-acid desaturase